MSLNIVHADHLSPQLNQVFGDFVKTILQRDLDFGPCASMGVLRAGEIVGAVVFHDWRPEYETIEMTGAALSRSWLSRKAVCEIARVCFYQLKANQIVARCDAANLTTTRIFKALGFECLALPNMRGVGRDELFFYQTRKMWENMRFAR